MSILHLNKQGSYDSSNRLLCT